MSMSTSESIKRKRGKNFNENEKSSLLDIVATYKNVIECVRTDVKSVKDKNKVWELIQNEYNSIQSSGFRNNDQLKALYDILKRNAKKEKCNDKVELYKTGGGKKNSTVSALSEKVIGILGDQIEPLINEFDSDANYVNNLQQIEIPIKESYSLIEVLGENDSTIDITQNEGQNNTEIVYIDDCENYMHPKKECTTKKYKDDLCEDSISGPAYTGKGVYKSLLEVSSKRMKRTDLLTKYEEDILKTKLETALINKETAMFELNIAKQKFETEQYIYESLKQNTDKC